MKNKELDTLASYAIPLIRTDGRVKWVDTATRPDEVNRLGEEIARHFRDAEIGAVVCWNFAGDAVLAHVIATHLGVRVARLENDLGLLNLDPSLPTDVKRVLAVAPAWTVSQSSETLFAMLESIDVQVIAFVSLLRGDERLGKTPEKIPYVVLGEQE